MDEKLFCIVTPEKHTYYRATPVATEFLDKDQNVIHTSGSLPDGEVTELTVSSLTVKHFENGKLHGKLEVINLANGAVTFSEEYEHGQLVRVTEHSLPSDIKSEVSASAKTPSYKGTVLKVSGDTRAFYVDGKQVAQETLSNNGTTVELLGEIPDGEVKEFYDNGTLKTEAVYQHNKLHGLQTRYNETGKILSKETYEQGILNGDAQYFSYIGNHTFCTQCSYKKALLHGEFMLTQEDNTVRVRAFYANGRLNGERKTYYPNEKLECEETWKDGKIQGERKLYFPTGELWYIEHYEEGRLEGERTELFKNGQVHTTEFYADGLLSGPRTLYTPQGQVLTREEYHWGQLVHNPEKPV